MGAAPIYLSPDHFIEIFGFLPYFHNLPINQPSYSQVRVTGIDNYESRPV